MPDRDIATVVGAYRHAADLLEQNPTLATPIVTSKGELFWSLWSFECPDGVPAMIAAIRRAVGGQWNKREQVGLSEPEMVFEREGYQIVVKRDTVCTRRVVGTETITLPAVEAAPERTVEREVVEWDCEPVLAEQVTA